MKRWSLGVALALACASLPLAAQAVTTVTFEDISPNDLADGYGGINGWLSIGGSGIADTDRGGHGLKAFYGHGGFLSFGDAPVQVLGMLYKSYAVPADEQPLTAVELWYQGRAVASFVDPRDGLALTWLATDYAGPVDAVRLRGGLEGFAIDDFTYVSSVPAPASAWLLSSGLAALFGWRRRRASAGDAAVHRA